MRISGARGQVLAFFALVLPIVLLPIAAYAVDASVVAGRDSGLQAATALAAEAAAQQLDVGVLRSSDALTLDTTAVRVVAARTLVENEAGAAFESSTIEGVTVTVVASEPVSLPFSAFASTVVLRASATARLVAGYESPSSRLPLPSSTF